jgi:hypothetical protein
MPINIKIKWTLNGIENIGISEDERVWRTPYSNGKSSYSLKEIKPHEHKNRLYFRIQKKRYSKERINELSVKLETEKIFTIPDPKDVPFKL